MKKIINLPNKRATLWHMSNPRKVGLEPRYGSYNNVRRKLFETSRKMKLNIFYILILLFISLGLKRPENILGEYYNYFGSKLKINSDSTFQYSWSFDTQSCWTKGKWKVKHHIVYFEIIPIYDTLRRKGKQDTLILSADEIPNLVTNDTALPDYFFGSGQINCHMSLRLYYKDDKLIEIDDKGKLITNKVHGDNTWYVRKDN